LTSLNEIVLFPMIIIGTSVVDQYYDMYTHRSEKRTRLVI